MAVTCRQLLARRAWGIALTVHQRRAPSTAGWDDDDDPEYTSSDEDELWEAVAEEIGTGRRPLDCQVRYVYHDTR
eukprot:COSAG01_NODE_27735_length_678_cov_1.037997_1_plen_74_part_10